jgi:DNA-binding beta-propeller fold protein YncE
VASGVAVLRGRRWSTGFASVLVALAAVTQASTSDAGASASGDRLWVTPAGTQSHHVSAVGSAVSPDGSRVFETGTWDAADGHDMYGTVAFDTVTGKRLWVARYRAAGDANDLAMAIAVSPDGDTVFVTGQSRDRPNLPDYATVAYDATTGAQRWVARFDDANHGWDTPHSLAVSPDGALVFVTGIADYGSGHGFGATIAYDAASGRQVWKTMIRGRAGPNAAGITVVATPDGSRVFVIGADTTTLTIAYNAATGAKLWSNAYHGIGTYASPSSGAVSRDASTLYVSGTDGFGCCISVYFTIAYDTVTGARHWVRRFPKPEDSNNNFANSIAVSPDGSAVFVTGYNDYLDRTHHFTTIAYDTSDGHMLWRRFYTAGNDSASAYSIAVSPDGNRVVVAGEGYFGSSVDYVTIAYDAQTGAQVWRARYDDPQHLYDSARAVAIDPTGSRVFVTGLGPMIAYAL